MKHIKLTQHTLCTFLFFTAVLFSSTIFANDQTLWAASAEATTTQTVDEQQRMVRQRVNINQASFEQLVTLPGIGKVKAQAIIDYRKQVGAFNSLGDIRNIKGIGEKMFIKLQQHIEL